jgi:hypothetical protein
MGGSSVISENCLGDQGWNDFAATIVVPVALRDVVRRQFPAPRRKHTVTEYIDA